MTKLVCTIADTDLAPTKAANETLTIVREIRANPVSGNRPEAQ